MSDTSTRAVLAPTDLPPRLRRALEGLPHYYAANGEVDPLTTEGPHRATWRLSGYREVGEGASGAAYFVTRWETPSGTDFVATLVTPGGGMTLHAYDGQTRAHRTLVHAETLAAQQRAADVPSAAEVDAACAALLAATDVR